MRYRLLPLLLILIAIVAPGAAAQAPADTIYNPTIVYTGVPSKYEIAGLRVTGADNYEDYIVIGYSVGILIRRTWIQGKAHDEATDK